MGKVVLAALAALAIAVAPAQAATDGPDQRGAWEPADKDGFGTAHERQSKVWYTLGDGRLTEVYYPNVGSPSVRKLEFFVSDGRGFSEHERRATRQRVELTDPRSLGYRQINTDRQGRYAGC